MIPLPKNVAVLVSPYGYLDNRSSREDVGYGQYMRRAAEAIVDLNKRKKILAIVVPSHDGRDVLAGIQEIVREHSLVPMDKSHEIDTVGEHELFSRTTIGGLYWGLNEFNENTAAVVSRQCEEVLVICDQVRERKVKAFIGLLRSKYPQWLIDAPWRENIQVVSFPRADIHPHANCWSQEADILRMKWSKSAREHALDRITEDQVKEIRGF